MPKFYNCVSCKKRTNPKERRVLTEDVKTFIQNKLFINKISSTDIICNKCKHKYYTAKRQAKANNYCTSTPSDNNDPDYKPPSTSTNNCVMASPPSIILSIPGTSSSHSRCIFCKRPGPKLVVVSQQARFWAFIERNVLIRPGSRCCPVHKANEVTIQSALLSNIPTTAQSIVNRATLTKLMQDMRQFCHAQVDAFVDFKCINDEDCINLTGLTSGQFEDLCCHVLHHVKSTPSRSPRMSVGIFLFKLKSGMSNRLLSTLFRLSKSSVRRAIKTVRKAMMRSFVPLHLGIECVTREKIINEHTRPLAKSLFGVGDNGMILVLDGTYIYIQKSNNFSFQRQSFSLHKNRPLVKPMVVVTSTGHFVTIMGPYLARNNDASILNHMFQRNIEDIKAFVQEDDVLVIDRGFRDSVSYLEEMGIRAAMPSFMKRGQKQMSTEDANNINKNT